MRHLYIFVIVCTLSFVPQLSSADEAKDPILVQCQVLLLRGPVFGKTSMDNDVRVTAESVTVSTRAPKSAPANEGSRARAVWEQVKKRPDGLGPHVKSVTVTGEGPKSAPTSGSSPAPMELEMMTFMKGTFQFGDATLTMGDEGFLWNGEPIERDAELAAGGRTRAQHLGNFRVRTDDGKMESCFIGSTQKVQYFEKEGENLFRLKKLEEETGFRLSLCPERGSDGRIRLSGLTATLRSVEEREPIPGLSLQVGKPIIKTRKYTASLRVVPGQPYGIVLVPGSGEGSLLIYLRAEPYIAQDAAADPGGASDSESASLTTAWTPGAGD